MSSLTLSCAITQNLSAYLPLQNAVCFIDSNTNQPSLVLVCWWHSPPMVQWYHSLGRSIHNMKLSCFKFKTCCSWSAATNAALVFSLCSKATWCFVSVINGEIAMIILSGLKRVHEFLKFDCKELSHLKIRLSKACEPIHTKNLSLTRSPGVLSLVEDKDVPRQRRNIKNCFIELRV